MSRSSAKSPHLDWEPRPGLFSRVKLSYMETDRNHLSAPCSPWWALFLLILQAAPARPEHCEESNWCLLPLTDTTTGQVAVHAGRGSPRAVTPAERSTSLVTEQILFILNFRRDLSRTVARKSWKKKFPAFSFPLIVELSFVALHFPFPYTPETVHFPKFSTWYWDLGGHLLLPMHPSCISLLIKAFRLNAKKN